MLTTTRTSDFANSRTTGEYTRLRHWLREPLLHFVLLGLLLFAADRWILGSTADPRTIVLSREESNEARELFKARRGIEPNPAELDALRRIWLDNEVLYREGLALQVDRGDAAIRERVIFKALSVVDAGIKAPPLDEQALRTWFESNRLQYDEPARYNFQEAMLYGDTSESAVTAFAEGLNKGAPGDVQAGLRVFKDRPRASLDESYGADFARGLDESPVGEWRAHKTGEKWRVIRLESKASGKPASFEALRGMLMQDWIDARMAEQRTAAVRALTRKYKIVYEEAGK